jgi:hypothetical protein
MLAKKPSRGREIHLHEALPLRSPPLGKLSNSGGRKPRFGAEELAKNWNEELAGGLIFSTPYRGGC